MTCDGRDKEKILSGWVTLFSPSAILSSGAVGCRSFPVEPCTTKINPVNLSRPQGGSFSHLPLKPEKWLGTCAEETCVMRQLLGFPVVCLFHRISFNIQTPVKVFLYRVCGFATLTRIFWSATWKRLIKKASVHLQVLGVFLQSWLIKMS